MVNSSALSNNRIIAYPRNALRVCQTCPERSESHIDDADCAQADLRSPTLQPDPASNQRYVWRSVAAVMVCVLVCARRGAPLADRRSPGPAASAFACSCSSARPAPFRASASPGKQAKPHTSRRQYRHAARSDHHRVSATAAKHAAAKHADDEIFEVPCSLRLEPAR
jgi:hypothetical protein